MRVLVAVAALSCSSCAWIFQEHLPSEYSGNSLPACTTSNGWAVVDGIFAGLNVIGIAGAASDDQLPNKSAYIVGGVVGGIVHIASAVSGAGWASVCRDAHEHYNAQPSIIVMQRPEQQQQEPRAPRDRGDHFWCSRDSGECTGDREVCGKDCIGARTVWCSGYQTSDTHEAGWLCGLSRDSCVVIASSAHNKQGRENFSECTERTQPLPLTLAQKQKRLEQRQAATPPAATPPAATPPAATPPPRGFFCSSSKSNITAGFCFRDKAECERTRDVSIGALPDLSVCTLVETATCVADLCFPTVEGCEARRKRTGLAAVCRSAS